MGSRDICSLKEAVDAKSFEKLMRLKSILESYGSVAIAFSGGVDSTFLLAVASNFMKESTMAITAASQVFPQREHDEAETFCRENNILQKVLHFDELSVEGFSENPKNRCYICKRALFGKIKELAFENGMQEVAEASNLDDNGDYRPGLTAVKELGIKSPLREAGFTKAEIRKLSKLMGLCTWDKPSFACLASRFPYGEIITQEKLSMVERAEQLLLDMGFRQMRVRIHGSLARIEVLEEDFAQIMQPDTRRLIYEQFRSFGFSYISVDLLGYRTGSMNEGLSEGELSLGRNLSE